MKQFYFLMIMTLSNFSFFAQSPLDNGTIVDVENFDTATVIPNVHENSSPSFKESVKLSETAANGTGQGVEFYFDVFEFTDEEITLHTFTNVAPGDYVIQYDIDAVDYTQSVNLSIISDGNGAIGTNQKWHYVYSDMEGYETRYTPQMSLTTTGNLSFTIKTGFYAAGNIAPSTFYVDNIKLIKMDDVLPTEVLADTVIQEENFDDSTVIPQGAGDELFTTSIKLSSEADFNGTGQGIEFYFRTSDIHIENYSVDLTTFTNVSPGKYYIEYQYNENLSHELPSDLSYYNQISDGINTLSNFISTPSNSDFQTHRTKSIDITTTSDLNLTWIGGLTIGNTWSTLTYIDNVKLIKENTVTLSNNAINNTNLSFAVVNNSIAINGLIEQKNYVLYSVLGAKLDEGVVIDKINIQNLANGVYFLRLENGQSFKFVK